MIDGLFQIRGQVPVREDIVILGINSESMEFLEDEIEQFPDLDLLTEWPWPREVHAMLLERLLEAGAAVVAFDILFLTPSLYGPEDDAIFRRTLEKYSERSVIGFDFADLDSGAGRSQRVMPAESVAPGDLREKIAGFVKYPLDGDGRIRRAYHETTAAISSGISVEPLAGEKTYRSFAALTAARFDPAVEVPGWRNAPLIPYAGAAGTYAQFPVFQVLHDRYWEQNFGAGEFFRDKIVLVGATAGFMHDTHETPFRTMAGIEIHANSIGMLLDGTSLREIPHSGRILLTVVAGMGLSSLILLCRLSYLLKFLLLMATVAAGVGMSVALFASAGMVIAFPHPYLAFLGAGFTGMALQFSGEQLEKRRLRRTLATFVSPDVAAYLVAHPEEYEEAAVGRRRHCTILFSDVRGFTSLTERAESPEAFVHQLNEYLSAWVESVFAEKGTLDKFVGDAVMAVWGGIRSNGPAADALSAVCAALAMREELERLNAKWRKEGLPEFRMGVGIAAGEAIVGNMGSPGRKLEFTAIGDAVNVAARLEGETKVRERELLISETVYGLINEKIEADHLGDFAVRGKERTVGIYAVRGMRDVSAERGPAIDPPVASLPR